MKSHISAVLAAAAPAYFRHLAALVVHGMQSRWLNLNVCGVFCLFLFFFFTLSLDTKSHERRNLKGLRLKRRIRKKCASGLAMQKHRTPDVEEAKSLLTRLLNKNE